MHQIKKIHKIIRENDVISGGEIKSLYTMDSFPVSVGCSQESEETDIKADMSWYISEDIGMVQLNPVLPLDLVYQEAHGSGCVGELWLQHHQEFAKFVRKQKPMSVLEIGGAHGILSREYKKNHPIDWTILEPNPSPAEGVDVPFIKGYFDDKFIFDGKMDTIIHSHVFEHVYYPNEFISHISGFLDQGQKLIFSLPNMEEMLK